MNKQNYVRTRIRNELVIQRFKKIKHYAWDEITADIEGLFDKQCLLKES